MKNTKSQMQITEQVGVLIIFFILLMLGFVFYSRFQESSIKAYEQDLKSQKSVITSLRASYLPELRCSTNNDLIIPNCIDFYKMIAFKEKFSRASPTTAEIEETDFYFNLLQNSRLTAINLITGESYELYNKLKKGSAKNISIGIPVLIHNPINEVSHFGVLNVEIFA